MTSTQKSTSPEGDERTLTHEEAGSDYTLAEGRFCWITVGNISVYIRHGDELASVKLYARQHEADNPLAEMHLSYQEAREYIDEARANGVSPETYHSDPGLVHDRRFGDDCPY